MSLRNAIRITYRTVFGVKPLTIIPVNVKLRQTIIVSIFHLNLIAILKSFRARQTLEGNNSLCRDVAEGCAEDERRFRRRVLRRIIAHNERTPIVPVEARQRLFGREVQVQRNAESRHSVREHRVSLFVLRREVDQFSWFAAQPLPI